jgi:hypothetical protein
MLQHRPLLIERANSRFVLLQQHARCVLARLQAGLEVDNR